MIASKSIKLNFSDGTLLIFYETYKNAFMTCNIPNLKRPDGIIFSTFHVWKATEYYYDCLYYKNFIRKPMAMDPDDEMAIKEAFSSIEKAKDNKSMKNVTNETGEITSTDNIKGSVTKSGHLPSGSGSGVSTLPKLNVTTRSEIIYELSGFKEHLLSGSGSGVVTEKTLTGSGHLASYSDGSVSGVVSLPKLNVTTTSGPRVLLQLEHNISEPSTFDSSGSGRITLFDLEETLTGSGHLPSSSDGSGSGVGTLPKLNATTTSGAPIPLQLEQNISKPSTFDSSGSGRITLFDVEPEIFSGKGIGARYAYASSGSGDKTVLDLESDNSGESSGSNLADVYSDGSGNGASGSIYELSRFEELLNSNSEYDSEMERFSGVSSEFDSSTRSGSGTFLSLEPDITSGESSGLSGFEELLNSNSESEYMTTQSLERFEFDSSTTNPGSGYNNSW